MIVRTIEAKLTKKEAIKHINGKTPILSKIIQFNRSVKDINISYIEFKVLKYEIITKSKNNNIFRSEIRKDEIIMLVNTQTGYSESIQVLPDTKQKYVSKSVIKKSKINEYDIIDNVKSYIMNYMCRQDNVKNISIQSIDMKEIYSIYKPYWVGIYNGRNIMIEA